MFRLEPVYPETRELLRRGWSRCLVEGSDRGDADDRDDPIDLRNETMPLPEQFAHDVASTLNLRAIEASAGRRLMFHAAGLADSAGRVLGLVAASGTGKTTLARELGRAGFGYVTDETLAVGRDGVVLTYPKPLFFVDSTDTGGKTQHGPDELGLAIAPANLFLHRLVLLERTPNSSAPPSLTAVPMMEALLDLIPQTSALSRLEEPLQLLCRTVGRCGAFRLRYAEAATTVELLHELLTCEASVDLEWAPMPRDVPPAPRPGTFVRGPSRDAVRIDDEGLVLLEDTPVRLGPLGLTIWERCGTGATHPELVTACTAEHGTTDDAPELVTQAITSMLVVGALRRG